MKPFPLITAHSGCEGTPDHTMLSLETALRLGADVVEEDIRVTRDGVLVLAHDDAVRLPDGSEYRISRTLYDDLRELEIAVRHGELESTIRLLRLEEILPLIQAFGKIINLDLKVDESIEPVSVVIEKNGLYDQAILSGCEIDRALQVQRFNPKLRKLLNADIQLFHTLEYMDAVIQTCEDALRASCFGINIHYQYVRPESLQAAEERNLPVCVWTINEVPEMKRFIEAGVHSITTRSVSALSKLKKQYLLGGL
ncbi:hypothetical protein LJK87_09770 [Paenibacillus sp. P25]|nr:hypothetical protein LJK87_09770 [Paenibacillus sp. P25]